MKQPLIASLLPLGAALLSCCLAGSCTTSAQRDSDAQPTNSRPAQPAAVRIAQLHHGREARFAACLPPACPVVTPKTLGRGDQAVPLHRSQERVDSANTIPGSENTRVDIAAPAPEPAQRPEQAGQPPSFITELAVTFASGSAALTAAARALIDQAVKAPGIAGLAIRGRTDSTGPAAVNQALATARARAVQAYIHSAHPGLVGLVSSIDASGACCYVASNETPDGRARNRRAEIDIERTSDDP